MLEVPYLAKSNRELLFIVVLVSVILILNMGFVIMSVNRSLIKPIVSMIDQLSQSSKRILSTSQQVSNNSMLVAGDASKQAAALEETSAALEEISASTKINAQGSREANSHMVDAGKIVSSASEAMKDLMAVTEKVSRESAETKTIIKTIDEIAFQTNLLALNAAVEAARAGDSGAGFAVVADEVRTLATRTGAAVESTSALIEGTVQKIDQIAELVKQTNAEFGEISESSSKVGVLVGSISTASNEQALGISQISTGVNSLDSSTQQNAETSEQLANASGQMAAEVKEINNAVDQLRKIVGQ